MEANEFGQYLKEIRKKRKLTIRQLDTYSGVSHSYISQMERGERGVPSPDILLKLSKPLGVKYEDLMEKAGYLNKEDVMRDSFSKGIIKLKPHEKYENEELFKEINENPDFFSGKDLEYRRKMSNVIFDSLDPEIAKFLIDIYLNENKKEVTMNVINELKDMSEGELNELLTFAKFRKSQSNQK